MTAAFHARPFAASDTAALLELLRREHRLLGQPEVTASMLEACLRGSSPVDGAWWSDLRDYQVSVLEGRGGLVGAVGTGIAQTDGAGYVLWLASGQNTAVKARLLDDALVRLAGTPVQRAFWFATALGAGLEGLPATRNSALHQALVSRGFTASDAWLYLHRDLGDITARAAEAAEAGSSVTIRLQGEPAVAEVVGALLGPRLGVISWLGVSPARRGQGVGRRLLDAMLAHLRHLGAAEVILFVDHDEPGGVRDRSATLALYASAGFTVVDHLWSYERH